MTSPSLPEGSACRCNLHAHTRSCICTRRCERKERNEIGVCCNARRIFCSRSEHERDEHVSESKERSFIYYMKCGFMKLFKLLALIAELILISLSLSLSLFLPGRIFVSLHLSLLLIVIFSTS